MYTDPEQKQLDCRNNSLPGGSGSDSGPPASSLGAAGQSPSSHRCRGSAPGPASSRLRPPSRKARSTFRRKRVRTLGGPVGLCCHGTSTFEGQRGVTGNTTRAVRVRNPEPVARRSGRFRPVSAQAGDQWPVTSGRRAGRRFLPVLHAARHTPLRPCALAVPHDLCLSGQRTVPVWGLSHWTVLAAVCL